MTSSETRDPLTSRVKVRRRSHRGYYDRQTIDSILDEAFVCHLGLVSEGQPYTIPTAYARDGDRLFIHGSSASRMMRSLNAGVDVCVTVTLVDGIVLARSAFNQSINYRSVMVLGRASVIDDLDEKATALAVMSEHIAPGRWNHVRAPSKKELAATSIVELKLDEASAKIRTGPPVDDEEDYGWPVWAGVIPIATTFESPEPDSRNMVDVEIPEHVDSLHRRNPR